LPMSSGPFPGSGNARYAGGKRQMNQYGVTGGRLCPEVRS
jgi:hypothetical protein